MTKRQLRILRVFFIAEAYSVYNLLYLSECMLKHENNYVKTENLVHSLNGIFNFDIKPSDLIKSEPQLIDEIIDYASRFRRLCNEIGDLKRLGITSKKAERICKKIERGRGHHILKSNMNFQYQVKALSLYVVKAISKETFLERIKEISIIDGSKKYNNSYFKKTFLSIENLIETL